jgi:hypothetical protein
MVQRTSQQNKAMWKYFEMLAKELNDAGLDQRVVLKLSVQIPWDKDDIHDRLWIPIQRAVVKTESTTELNKQQVSEIFDILNRHLSEKFGISVQFPSNELGYWETAPLK